MSLPLIDTHCHLAAEELAAERASMIARARDAGVVAMVCVGEHYEDNLRVLELAAAEPMVHPAVGHHPWYMDRARRDVPRTLQLIEEQAASLVAIGEVGLDYRVADTPAASEDQRAVFREFVAAGKQLGLPLSVHVRSAGHYVIDLLREEECSRAALHAFDGKARYAREGAAFGLHFSVPATVLVSRQKQKLARAVPLDRLLLESDTPALSPEPDTPSEPAMVADVAQAIAELTGESVERIREATYENARALFNLSQAPSQATG